MHSSLLNNWSDLLHSSSDKYEVRPERTEIIEENHYDETSLIELRCYFHTWACGGMQTLSHTAASPTEVILRCTKLFQRHIYHMHACSFACNNSVCENLQSSVFLCVTR